MYFCLKQGMCIWAAYARGSRAGSTSARTSVAPTSTSTRLSLEFFKTIFFFDFAQVIWSNKYLEYLMFLKTFTGSCSVSCVRLRIPPWSPTARASPACPSYKNQHFHRSNYLFKLFYTLYLSDIPRTFFILKTIVKVPIPKTQPPFLVLENMVRDSQVTTLLMFVF